MPLKIVISCNYLVVVRNVGILDALPRGGPLPILCLLQPEAQKVGVVLQSGNL